MILHQPSVDLLKKVYYRKDFDSIIRFAKEIHKIEIKYQKKFDKRIQEITEEILANAEKTGYFKESIVNFDDLVMRHFIETSLLGVKSTDKNIMSLNILLANVPKNPARRSYKEIRQWWDFYRKKKIMPEKQKKIAEDIKKAYLDKCKKAWVKYGDDFRSGVTAQKKEAISYIKKAADITKSRSNMIVATETTSYYNKVRTDIYDQSPDITHYLFLAIRDFRTTKWCLSRSGLVFKKGTQLQIHNTPACHWNCRSEMLPLSPLNPVHETLINDPSRNAANKYLVPLPPGWVGGSKL